MDDDDDNDDYGDHDDDEYFVTHLKSVSAPKWLLLRDEWCDRDWVFTVVPDMHEAGAQ